MEEIEKNLRDKQIKIKKITLNDIENIVKKLNEQNIMISIKDVKNKLKCLDDELTETLGMIEYMHSKMNFTQDTNKSILFNNVNSKLTEIKNMLTKLMNENYIETSDHLYIKKREKNETWKVLIKIFSFFMNVKTNFDTIFNSTESYTNVSEKLIQYMSNCMDNLIEIEKYIVILLTEFGNLIESIKKSVSCECDPDDIVYAENKEHLTKDSLKYKINTNQEFVEMITGYDGLITEKTIDIMDNAFDSLHLEDINDMYLNQLKLIYDKIKILDIKKYDGIQTGGNKNMIQLMYKFNIKLQNIQSSLNILLIKWKEYQNYKMRFYNYFAYQIYCMTIFTELNIGEFYNYKYIDKETIIYYLKILQRIIQQFGNYDSIDEKEKKYIEYLNIYHYFTIKRLNKLFTIMSNIIGKNIINVEACRSDTRITLDMFNCFKKILDDYYEKIMKNEK